MSNFWKKRSEITRSKEILKVTGTLMEKPRICIRHFLPCAWVLIVSAGCASHRSFTKLSANVEAVPVPSGVTFVGQQQQINNGPGFTRAKFEEVTRQYRTNLPCGVLEDVWAQALRAAGRRFRIANYPHKFGAIGSLEIQLNDRPEALGINLGTDNGLCASPFVYSFNSPH